MAVRRRWSPARAGLVAVDGMVALTAVGGGVALASGLEAQNFGPELLEGTPFSSYAGPGLILAVAVGGTAAVATIAAIRRPALGGLASIGAGLVLIGWIAGEIVLLAQPSEPTGIEALYLAAGAVMGLLGARVWLTFRRVGLSR